MVDPSTDASPACPQRGRWTVRHWAAFTAILIAAGGLRIAAAHNDLWLDEIWSLDLAGKVHAPIEVFTSLHHDNNHYLNTLWLWVVGPEGNWFSYRLVSLLAGMGTVVLAGMIGARRDAATGWIAMLVFGVSYVMVLYSSEARGYGMVCFFALWGFHSLERFFAKRSWTAAAIYVVSVVMGLLSQPVFVSFLAAAILASLVWLMRPLFSNFAGMVRPNVGSIGPASSARPASASAAERGTAPLKPTIWSALAVIAIQLVPLLALLLLYLVDLRQLTIGGGTSSESLLHSYASALAWTLGTPLTGVPLAFGCLVAIALCGAGLQLVWRESPDQAVFFLGVIVVFPLGLAIVRASSVLYPRYFILSMEFLLLLMSFWLGSLWTGQSRWHRTAAVAIVLAFCVANGVHLASLLRHGRGDTSGALRFMAERTPGPVISLSADNGFRIAYPAVYIARTAVPDKTIRVSRMGPALADGPEWFICHKESFEPPVPYSAELFGRTAHPYRLEATFPAAPLSGLHWFVYRRQ
ncbi:MAG: hypothetical protein WD845_16045 [Pirellulales bacterium]